MAAAPSMETFDAYFRRADLDQDGRISGAEAVAFLQGSNLPKHILAQIWMHADQSKTGFLGRTEFYNVLKLVTVAQSGRELTPDIVKAALYGPAAGKIPAPKINPVAASATQTNMIAPSSNLNSMVRPSFQTGNVAPVASQNLGFIGPQVLPSAGPVQGVNPGRPSGGGVNPQLPWKGSIPDAPLPGSNVPPQTSWLGTSFGGSSQIPVRGSTHSGNQDFLGLANSGAANAVTPRKQTPSVTASILSSKQQDPSTSQPAGPNSEALAPSGNGLSSVSVLGGDIFSATPKAKTDALVPSFSTGTMPNFASSTLLPLGPQNSKPGQLNSLNSVLTSAAGNNQSQQNKQSLTQTQLGSMQNPLGSMQALPTSNASAGSPSSISSQSELMWPKFTQSDIKKYTAVFVEVDKDRDGKITGEQARNLFLSWRLPREVLKQVWDLSDQDNDSMLSLREFCTALYLMERYRQGRPLPSVLPNSVKFDEVLLQTTGLPSNAYGAPAWQPNAGSSQQGVPVPSGVIPSYGLKRPVPNSVSVTGGGRHPLQPKKGIHVLESRVTEEQSALDLQSPKALHKKVNEVEKQLLDSKEKIEFYRTKMQELVLYKSRCDNRLNEITERASADKREVEALAKKYEEKYKQVGEIASKLAVEEATFRDIQERKLELQNAIVKMEQGGSVDGLLQVRADRIQSDLEELERALHDRCKIHKLNIKQTASIELPYGWQPGMQEGAVEWDEEWDKFEDEGFMLSTDLSVEIENGGVGENVKSPSIRSDKAEEDSLAVSSSHKDSRIDKLFNDSSPREQVGSAFAYSEEGSARSPTSPARSTSENMSNFNPENDFALRAKEYFSDHGAAESTISGDKYADDHSWGPTFDANDDADSVWGFTTKESDVERNSQSSFFGPGDFGLNPIKLYSPSGSSVFDKDKKSPFFDSVPTTPAYSFGTSPRFSGSSVFDKDKKSPFFDSVPSTPGYSFGTSPRFSGGPGDNSFDNISRFDSFRIQDSGFQPQRESLTRFDSIRSTSDFGHSRGFTFDDADPFGSMGPFKVSDNQNSPRRTSDNQSAF